MTAQAPPASESIFDRGAWLTLIGAVLLAAAGLGVFVWRYRMPTDGWWVESIEGQESVIFLSRNLMGAPSDLQPGDRLLAVNGHAFEGYAFQEFDSITPAAEAWQAGGTVRYTVERQGAPIEVDVPLVRWNSKGLWRIAQTAPGQIADALGGLLFLAIALFTLVKRPGNHAARALLLLAASTLAASGVTSILPFGVSDSIDPAFGLVQLIFIIALFTVLLPPTLLRFGLVFPRIKPSVLRRPWFEYAPYMVGVGMLPAFALTNGLANWIWTAASVAGAIVLLVHSSLTMRDAISRAQLRWGLGGMIAGLFMILAGYPADFGWTPGVLGTILLVAAGWGPLVMGVSLSVAVLRYRLYDIDLIIRRTLIYGVLTVTLAAIYFGSVALLQSIATAVGGQQSAIVTVASTLAIAALFSPLRRRVQDFIDHRFYRRKYDAARTLDEFAATARNETDLERLTGRLVSVVDRTVQPVNVSLWLTADKKPARYGGAADQK